jgi:hypothetical protein
LKKLHIILVTFLLTFYGLLYPNTNITGKITTIDSKPVSKAKISFINSIDTNRCFSSLTDSLGNYNIIITKVESKDKEDAGFRLYQNYPNPFSKQTTITYQVKQHSPVVITIYNVLGQRVKKFQSDYAGENIGHVQWDGTDVFGKKVANGIYFYSIAAGDKRLVKKMLFIDNMNFSATSIQVFSENTYYYKEDLYQDSSNVYTVSIDNTEDIEPMIELTEIKNVVIHGDTTLNFQVNELQMPQWPMARQNSYGRGNQLTYPYAKGLKDTNVNVLWRRGFSGRVVNICTNSVGDVFVGVNYSDTLMYAFSSTGQLLWTVNGLGIAIREVPITIRDDSTIILSTVTFDGQFTAAFDNNGVMKWRIEIGSTYSPPALSKNGIMYFCTYIWSGLGELIAINTYTGDTVWTKYGAYSTNSPVLDSDGNIYYCSYVDKAIISLTPGGSERWRYTDSTGVLTNSLVIDAKGNLYFYKEGKFGSYCLSKQGELRWIGRGGSNYAFDSPAITPDGNIVTASELRMYLYNSDGNLIWEMYPPYEIISHPIIDKSSNIYFGSWGLLTEGRPDFFRITKSGRPDIIFKGTTYEVWWLVLANNGLLYYYGYYDIVCIK